MTINNGQADKEDSLDGDRSQENRKSRDPARSTLGEQSKIMSQEKDGRESSTKLSQIDWDFADSSTRDGIHSIHPYPAKFIPQIPRQLIELYAPDKSITVLDPFCGVGTSLVESLSHGHDAVGVDLHPLACLISRVKTRPLPDEFTEISRRVVSESRSRYPREDPQPPELPNLDHWFEKSVQKALTIICDEISDVQQTELREALMVALSAIIVKVSNQDSDTRYAAVEKGVDAEDVFQEFARSASRIEEGLLKQKNWDSSLPDCQVINQDVLTVAPEDIEKDVDLVITSPPYPNAYEYWLYHKYRTYWLGLGDPTEVREQEIGARPHYHGSDPQDEEDFERQMNVVFSLLGEVTTSEARACFIVGRSIIQGREIDNAAILDRAANSGGFNLEASASREILSSAKSFNPGYSSIKNEKVLVFSKEGS